MVTASASPERVCSSDVDPFGTARAGHPLNPNFVLYYAIDVDANDDDGAAGDGVKRSLMVPSWGCRVVDTFLC